MRVRVTANPPLPPNRRESAGQVWPEGDTEHDLPPATVRALEAEVRIRRPYLAIEVTRLDAADLVQVRATVPARRALSGNIGRDSTGRNFLIPFAGVLVAGVYFGVGTSTLSITPEVADEAEAEIAAGRSILTLERLSGAGAPRTTTPTAAALQALT